MFESKETKAKLARIEELEKQYAMVRLELEASFNKLIREAEHEYGQKIDHQYGKFESLIERELSKISNANLSKEIEDLRNTVYAKLAEFSALSDELRDLTVKQKSYINLAAQEAVEKALQGELKTIVTLQLKKIISEEGKELLFDESHKSLLGTTEELTQEVIEMLKKEIPNVLLEGTGAESGKGGEGASEGGKPKMTKEEEKALEERKADVLSKGRHRDFPKLVGALSAGLMPMLVGPAGTGKSTAVEQAAFELGFNFYTSNRVQMSYELTGYKDAGGKYQPTQFYEAYKNGGVFFLDEIDGSSPEALVTINTAMAQGYMNFPDGKVYMHKDFRLAAAGNTYGTGADAQYVGRNELDAATLDRFVVIKWDYDKKLEKKIIKDDEFLKFGWALRDAIAKLKLPIIISTRGLINMYKLSKVNSFTMEELLESVLLEGVDAQTILTISREMPTRCKYKKALDNLAKKVHASETNSEGEDENEA